MVVCTVNSAYCLTITQDHPANSKDIGSITELKKETNWDYNEVEGQKEKRTKRLNLCDTIFCTGQCESVSSAILGNTWYIYEFFADKTLQVNSADALPQLGHWAGANPNSPTAQSDQNILSTYVTNCRISFSKVVIIYF